LLATGLLAGDTRLVEAARRNLDWALTQQTTCGWFATNAFVPWRSPFTHSIAYAVRGFLESAPTVGGTSCLIGPLGVMLNTVFDPGIVCA